MIFISKSNSIYKPSNKRHFQQSKQSKNNNIYQQSWQCRNQKIIRDIYQQREQFKNNGIHQQRYPFTKTAVFIAASIPTNASMQTKPVKCNSRLMFF